MRSIIISAGTYAKTYFTYLHESGINIVGFLDDNISLIVSLVENLPVLGTTKDLEKIKNEYNIEAVYCPMGDNELRVKFLKQAKSLGLKTPSFIHSSAIISPNVEIGEGVYILLGSHIMPFTKINDYVMISMNVNVAHHNILEEGTFLSTGVNFGASIIAHKKTYIGIGATIMTGIHELGENCLVGAGAVVIKDVPDNAIVAGVPAKIIRIKKLLK